MTEFDAETFRLIRSYCGGDPRIPREVSEEVYHEYGGGLWTLEEFQALIADAVAKIPEDRREAAVVELEGGYDESTRLVIRYSRMETPEEVAGNVQRALAYAHSTQNNERAAYEALKAKFG